MDYPKPVREALAVGLGLELVLGSAGFPGDPKPANERIRAPCFVGTRSLDDIVTLGGCSVSRMVLRGLELVRTTTLSHREWFGLEMGTPSPPISNVSTPMLSVVYWFPRHPNTVPTDWDALGRRRASSVSLPPQQAHTENIRNMITTGTRRPSAWGRAWVWAKLGYAHLGPEAPRCRTRHDEKNENFEGGSVRTLPWAGAGSFGIPLNEENRGS